MSKFMFIDNGEGAEKGVDTSEISAIEIDSRGLTVLLKSGDKLILKISQSFPRKGFDEFGKEQIRGFYESLKKEL